MTLEEKRKQNAAASRRYRAKKFADVEWCRRRNAKRRTGRPVGRRSVPAEKRFWIKVNKTRTCWLWIAATDKDGYGQFRDGEKRQVKAHRFAYELIVGPIPEGLQLDHVKAKGCTSPACVNPGHLEPVTSRDNTIRGIGPTTAGARNAAKTRCPKGHPYDEQNTRVDRFNRRHCKACHG